MRFLYQNANFLLKQEVRTSKFLFKIIQYLNEKKNISEDLYFDIQHFSILIIKFNADIC